MIFGIIMQIKNPKQTDLVKRISRFIYQSDNGTAWEEELKNIAKDSVIFSKMELRVEV